MLTKLYEIIYNFDKHNFYSDVVEGTTETEAVDNFFDCNEFNVQPKISEVVCLGIKEELYKGE